MRLFVATLRKLIRRPATWITFVLFVALLGLIFLFHTIVAVIDIWLPEWAGYLITTGLLFAVAAVLALIGKKNIANINGKPERTIKNAQDTIETLKSGS